MEGQRGEGGSVLLCAAPPSLVQQGVRMLWEAVYTRLLITHTAVRHGAAARQSGKPAGAATARGRARPERQRCMQESEPNYICLCLLPGVAAASQRPRVKAGEAAVCFCFPFCCRAAI